MRLQYPELWNKHLEEKIDKIHKDQIEAYRDCSTVGMITDIHWICNKHYSAPLLKKVLDDCSIPYYFNGGDVISGQGICPPERIIKELIDYRETYKETESKCLVTEGNHDKCFSTFKAPDYYAENLSNAQFFEYYFRPMTLYPDRIFGNGSYFYADHVPTKTRYIVLNSHDIPTDKVGADGKPVINTFRSFGFREEQLKWLCQKALDVPSPEWSVFVCSHEQPDISESCLLRCNYEATLEIFDMFRRHKKGHIKSEYPEHSEYNVDFECNFENKGGDFICWLVGHEHTDRIRKINGITYVITDLDAGGTNKPDSINDQAFDIFVVNKRTHTVKITRIGRGEDREFTYDVY